MPVEKNLNVDRDFVITAKADEYTVTIPAGEFDAKLKGLIFQELGLTVLPPGTTIKWSFTSYTHELDRDEIITGIQAVVTIPQSDAVFVFPKR